MANRFLNNQNAAYQGFRHRTSLDVWDHRITASAAMALGITDQQMDAIFGVSTPA